MRQNLDGEKSTSVEELLGNALETTENDETKYYIREALQKLKVY